MTSGASDSYRLWHIPRGLYWCFVRLFFVCEGFEKSNSFIGKDPVKDRNFTGGLLFKPLLILKYLLLSVKRYEQCFQIVDNQLADSFSFLRLNRFNYPTILFNFDRPVLYRSFWDIVIFRHRRYRLARQKGGYHCRFSFWVMRASFHVSPR